MKLTAIRYFVVMVLCLCFSACSQPITHTETGKLMKQSGEITGYVETVYEENNSIVSIKVLDTDYKEIISLSADAGYVIRADTPDSLNSKEYAYIMYRSETEGGKINRETFCQGIYRINDGKLLDYELRNWYGIQEYKYYYNNEVIISENIEGKGFLICRIDAKSNTVEISTYDYGDCHMYSKSYDATTGEFVEMEYVLYDKDGLCLGTYVYDAENNKTEEKLTHYIKEYKNNGEATVTLYDYAGNELGTAKYSGGYCQDGG